MRRFIAVKATIRAPAEKVWRIITDTHLWPRWGPSVTSVTSSSRYVRTGMSGSVRTPVGLRVPFLVTECDEGQFWRWEIAGVAATGHRVTSIDEETCELCFEVPTLAAPYALVCRLACRRIAGLAEV